MNFAFKSFPHFIQDNGQLLLRNACDEAANILDFRTPTWQSNWSGLPVYPLVLSPGKTLRIPTNQFNFGSSHGGFNFANPLFTPSNSQRAVGYTLGAQALPSNAGGSSHPAKTTTHSIRLLLEIQNPARGNAYVQQIASQHDDPTFTDVILVCHETEIPCHRVILAARSELFKMMLSNTNFKEGLTHRVEVDGMSQNTLMAMLKYIYTDDFRPDDINLCELYTTAGRYMIAGLVQKCECYMHESLSVERAAEYFLLSHLHLPALTKLNEATKRLITEKFQDVKKT